MNLRRAAKLPVDIAMAAMLLWMMGYPVTRGLLRHGTLGCIVIGLFVLHHLLNLSWHRTLLRGRWSRLRLLSAAADILLIAAFAFLLASSLAMAGDVFPFAPFAMPWWGRDLHYASTAWIFSLAAFHMGLHGNAFWAGLRAAAQKLLGRAWLPAAALLLAAGAASFWKTDLPEHMLLLDAAPGQPSPWLFYARLAGAGMFWALLARVARWLAHGPGLHPDPMENDT